MVCTQLHLVQSHPVWPRAPLRSPGENLAITDEEDWLRQDLRDHPPNASFVPHGISTWNILSVTGILLKHRLCKQLQSCGRSLPLQPEALESRHCSATYPRHWLTHGRGLPHLSPRDHALTSTAWCENELKGVNSFVNSGL